MNQRLRTLYILLGISILMLGVGLVLLLVQSGWRWTRKGSKVSKL